MNAAASASLERVTTIIAAAIMSARGGPFSPGKGEAAVLLPQQHPDEALSSIEKLLDEVIQHFWGSGLRQL